MPDFAEPLVVVQPTLTGVAFAPERVTGNKAMLVPKLPSNIDTLAIAIETALCATNCAVYVVSAVGVEMLCTRAPPSDQDEKTQLVPWGDTASRLRVMPSTPTNVCGAVTGCPSRRSCNAAGLVASVMVDLRGWMSRLTECVRPPESVTRRWNR